MHYCRQYSVLIREPSIEYLRVEKSSDLKYQEFQQAFD